MGRAMDITCFCGSDKLIYLGDKQSAKILKCEICGTIFPDKYLYSEDFYRNEYAKEFQESKGHLPYTESYIHDRNVAKNRLKPILNLVNLDSSILEIGSGTGAFVDEANEAGFDAHGIELMDFPNLNVIRDNFLTHEFNRRFDVLALFDVLEHLPFPGFAIAKINSLAKQFVVLDQPDPESHQAVSSGISWHHIKPLEHNFLLSRRIISKFFSFLNWVSIFETSQVPGRMYLIYAKD